MQLKNPIIKSALNFLLVAPPIGGIAICIIPAIINPVLGVWFVVIGVFSSYFLGGVPALMTGASYGYFSQHLTKKASLASSALVGGLFSMLFIFLYFRHIDFAVGIEFFIVGLISGFTTPVIIEYIQSKNLARL